MQANEPRLIMRKGIYFQVNEKGKFQKHKPWLGDLFSCFYDRIMEKSIFPRKFEGDIKRHFAILEKEFTQFKNCNILDIAAGSGNLIPFLDTSNSYFGTDISSGLLRLAGKRLKQNNFQKFQLFICDVNNLPVKSEFFDIAVCNLSINFFPDLTGFVKELKRVLLPEGSFFCSIPLPEKKAIKVKIRGKLYSQVELEDIFENAGFDFKPLPHKNGCLLYFWAVKK